MNVRLRTYLFQHGLLKIVSRLRNGSPLQISPSPVYPWLHLHL